MSGQGPRDLRRHAAAAVQRDDTGSEDEADHGRHSFCSFQGSGQGYRDADEPALACAASRQLGVESNTTTSDHKTSKRGVPRVPFVALSKRTLLCTLSVLHIEN